MIRTYKTREFKNFIKKENQEKYINFNTELVANLRDGSWIEIVLLEKDLEGKEKSYEVAITDRREKLVKDEDENGLKEM